VRTAREAGHTTFSKLNTSTSVGNAAVVTVLIRPRLRSGVEETRRTGRAIGLRRAKVETRAAVVRTPAGVTAAGTTPRDREKARMEVRQRSYRSPMVCAIADERSTHTVSTSLPTPLPTLRVSTLGSYTRPRAAAWLHRTERRWQWVEAGRHVVRGRRREVHPGDV
jgi:hypothetical protein